MKKIITILLILITFFISAQNKSQLIIKTSGFAEIVGGKLEQFQKKNYTFIFNYGENKDVKFYYSDGTSCVYKRISEPINYEAEDGVKSQFISVSDEKGLKCSIIKFDNGVIKILYQLNNSESSIFGFEFYP